MTQEVIDTISTVLQSIRLNPVRSDTTAETVNEILPELTDAIKKLRVVLDVVVEELEVNSNQLAHVIAEHVLMCYRSRDPTF
jgi:biotin synthase-related radical SAM superfamily protein